MRGLVPFHGSRGLTTRQPVALTHFKSRIAIEDRFEVKFVKLLHDETRDSVWDLVDRLRQAKKRLPLVQAAVSHSVSQEELGSFRGIVFAKDLDAAFSCLRETGFATTTTDATNGLKYIPTWLVLFLITHKVQTLGQTGPMLDMVYTYLDVIPLHLRPSMLVMAALALARFNVLSSLRPLVQKFLTTPLSYPNIQFNLLLRAISRFPSSAEAAKQVVVVLNSMQSRQIPLQSRTYDALLRDRFVTLQLVKTLRARMIRDGFVPTAAHLEAYLRIFAKHGAIHRAKGYRDIIHALAVQKKARPDSSEPNTPHPDPSTRNADTLYIAAYKEDRASAFRYLSKLLKDESDTNNTTDDPPPHFPRTMPRFGSPAPRNRVDIFDWTNALVIAARDKSTTSETLVNLFQDAQSRTTRFRPTIATYTVVIRGLLYRGDYARADNLWNKLLDEPFVLDRQALTVGLQVLTRSGKPHIAFETLEYFAFKPNAEGATSPTLFHASPCYPPRRAVTMSTIAINEFMVALVRIGRPDVVFKLWDHMEILYGVSPNAITLSILLQAARLSARLDDSFTGALSRLASKNPFRKSLVKPSGRADIVYAIQRMLMRDDGELKDYATATWNALPPWRNVVDIFREAILGNWPDLVTVQPPAKVTHDSGQVNTLHPGSARIAGRYAGGRMPDSWMGSRAPYPQIYPTNATFLAYIQLLGFQSLATEIPLALAWMRALDIKPSRHTLSVALVFWAEVSLHGPLIEKLVGERSEYLNLVRWIREWVGDKGTPNDKDMRRWLKHVARIRANG